MNGAPKDSLNVGGSQSYRAVQIGVRGVGLRGWIKVLWGADVWIGPVPLMKSWLVVFVVAALLVGRLA